jgi:hypothetical protein
MSGCRGAPEPVEGGFGHRSILREAAIKIYSGRSGRFCRSHQMMTRGYLV